MKKTLAAAALGLLLSAALAGCQAKGTSSPAPAAPAATTSPVDIGSAAPAAAAPAPVLTDTPSAAELQQQLATLNAQIGTAQSNNDSADSGLADNESDPS